MTTEVDQFEVGDEGPPDIIELEANSARPLVVISSVKGGRGY